MVASNVTCMSIVYIGLKHAILSVLSFKYMSLVFSSATLTSLNLQ